MRIAMIIGGLLLAGSLHAADADNDGVDDSVDKCPNTAQLVMLPEDFKFRAAVNPERLSDKPKAHPVDEHGCERDTDGDGVIDSKDYCPEDEPRQLTHGVASNGCPQHSDQDGVPDYRDECPDTARGVSVDIKGCPKG